MEQERYIKVRKMLKRVSITSFLLLVQLMAFAAPEIATDPSIDLGEVVANGIVAREMFVRNVGDKPLEVSRVKACCGAKVTLAEMMIPPGTSSVLRVEINPGANPGPFRKSVTVYSVSSLLAVIADLDMRSENRVSAIALAGDLGVTAALPSVR